jgi:GR25 family glycosyltransferase involved in LPS biosynthesis
VSQPPSPTGAGPFAELLGVHLAEVEARLDAWGIELRRALAEGAPRAVAPAPGAVVGDAAPPPAPPRPALRTTPLFRHEAAAGLEGWSPTVEARLEAGGVIVIEGSRHAPGIVSAPLPAPAERLLKLDVTLETAEGEAGPAPVLRVTNELGEPLAADLPCGPGLSEHLVFVPLRTRELRFHLVARRPGPGRRFTLQTLAASGVDPDSHQAQQRHDIGAPVIASLASIPDRRAMLADAVASLLLQCDQVRVFLNDYPNVPDFLVHPRLDVRRSQDWDDRGDAGKFGWVDLPDPPGYRIVTDDDLVFPPDFARGMVAAVRRHDDRAFVGLHGILLRQPLRRYYDEESRSSFHFGRALEEDRTVHVLGTNALCYASALLGLRWADFQHRNMADIFLALHAQRAGIPMVAVARPRDWVRQNRQDHAFETIYDASLKATGTRFDTSRVQDALVRRAWPITLQASPRPKVVVCLLATDAAAADASFTAFLTLAATSCDWAVVLCPLAEDAALAAWVAGQRVQHELHVLDPQAGAPVARLAAAVALCERLGGQQFCLMTDELRLSRAGWIEALAALRARPAEVAFGHRDTDGRVRLLRSPLGPEGALPALALATFPLGAGDVDVGLPDVAAALGDWLVRLGHAAIPTKGTELPETGTALRAAPGYRSLRAPEAESSGLAAKAGWRRVVAPPRAPHTVNEAFERVCVINLDRRPDRWRSMRMRLATAGIRAERVAALDGAEPELRASYEAYAARPAAAVPSGVRAVSSTSQFFRDYDSQAARLAFEEGRVRRKAIGSAGAWAYLLTWQRILEQALDDGVGTLLVLDDDAAFHTSFPELFAAAWQELPPDWMVLQLGTLQYDWGGEAVRPVGRHLYRTGGSAIGSHAVGLRFEVLPYLLDQVRRRDMPFDIGALSAATRTYSDQSFIIRPNAVIQTLEDSDIGTSEFQRTRTLADTARSYRWHLPDYDL